GAFRDLRPAEVRRLPERPGRARQRELPQSERASVLRRTGAGAHGQLQDQRSRRPARRRRDGRRGERAPRLDAAQAALRLPAGQAAPATGDRAPPVPGEGNALVVPEGDARAAEGAPWDRPEGRRPAVRAGEGSAGAAPPEVEGRRASARLGDRDLAEPPWQTA